ncbi:hypothetical protein B0H16DRAFT_1569635 [Mycena metata]|uniref:F-box domain-containing protein n=1 Tax=Mycena metata TaxID=1033252 RepID=A0AAD7IAL3_9AGAR|nr:hypothetical protein B0H16DRAFT_1569635 [Mycena metata]
MLLNELDIDVLSHIFILTDVYTIMSLSKVNKSFHAISRAKHLWVSVVRDLYARRLIDLGVDEVLEECSTQTLIDKVRRVVLGPSTWSPSSPIAPTICRQMTHLLDSPRMRFELVPGGRYLVLFVWRGSHAFGVGGDVDVECLEVASGRRVWSWGRPGHRVSHTEFDFSCGSEAVVCVVSSDLEEPFSNQIFFLSVNFETGDTIELLGLPELPFLLGRPRISGDFFACAVSGSTSSAECIVLVNWRTADFILLNMKSAQFNLVHGHLITLRRASESTVCLTNYLRVYSMATLHPFWHPLREFDIDTRTNPGEILSVVSETICADNPGHHLHILVAESALHQQTYELIISLVDLAAPPPLSRLKRLRNRLTRRRPRNECQWMTTLFRYHLALPLLLDENPRLRLKSTLQHSLTCIPNYRAGYSLWAAPWGISSIVVRHLDEEGIKRGRQLPILEGEEMYQVEMAPSGAVVILYESRVVVSYFL